MKGSIMPRKLSRAEKEYIDKNYKNMSPEELCDDMPNIGPATVSEYINTISLLNKEENIQEDVFNEGSLMGRDPARGVVVMTQAASELSDARRITQKEIDEAIMNLNKDRIHIIKKEKK